MTEKIGKIKESILKSGFPFQMQICDILSKRGYDVTNGIYFYDSDMKIARELDIEATFPDKFTETSNSMDRETWSFNPLIIAECKKSEKYNWIFFDSNPINSWIQLGHSIDQFSVRGSYSNSVIGNIFHELDEDLHYCFPKYITNAYLSIRLDGNESGKNEILDATSKLIKFINFVFSDLKNSFIEDKERKDALFFYPIVVFAGDLYFASFNNELVVEPVSHLVYETNYFSTLTGELVPIYIDIVRKDGLPELLSTIEKEVSAIVEVLKSAVLQEKLEKIFLNLKN